MTTAIDDLAEELTGHREYFWAHPHRSPPTPGASHEAKNEPDAEA